MASTFEDLLQLELQVTGENSTTWGSRTNDNFERLADAIAGHESFSIAGSGDHTISQGTAVALTFRRAFWTVTGTLTGTRVLVVPASAKTYYIRNATTGSYGLTIKTAGGVAATVTAGGVTIIVCDGTDCYAAVDAVSRLGDTMSGKLTITSGGLAVDHNVSVSGTLYIGSTVSVSGAAAFGSTVSVSGAATFKDTVSVSGAAVFGGLATFNSTVSVSGAATFKDTVSVSGSFTVGGIATFNSNVSVSGTAAFGSTVSVSGTMVVLGSTDFKANVSVSAGLIVGGAATFGSTVSVSAGLFVRGAARFDSTVSVSAGAYFGADVTVVGGAHFQASASIGGTLTISGVVSTAASYSGSNAIFAAGSFTLVSGTPTLSTKKHNVAAVSNVGTGRYRVVFTSVAAHAEYAVLITPQTSSAFFAHPGFYQDRLTSSFTIFCNFGDIDFEPDGFSFMVVAPS